jgi:hypothetical protein
MNKDYTHVSMLLDRSGSMGSISADIIGGFNKFLDDQKNQGGKMTLTLAQFDNEYELLQDMVEIAAAKNLNPQTYSPRGSTALYDSLSKLIADTGHSLFRMDEKERPGNVIFVILTDGQENCSKRTTRQMIVDQIEHQTKQYNWHFEYIGANQDSFAAGVAMGNRAGSNLNYAAGAAGVAGVFAYRSASLAGTRATHKYTAPTQEELDKEVKKQEENN